MHEQQKQLKGQSPDPITDSPLDSMGGGGISELLKGSAQVPLDDPVGKSALDDLYRQAVEVAEEMEWPVPSRAEFEAQ